MYPWRQGDSCVFWMDQNWALGQKQLTEKNWIQNAGSISFQKHRAFSPKNWAQFHQHSPSDRGSNMICMWCPCPSRREFRSLHMQVAWCLICDTKRFSKFEKIWDSDLVNAASLVGNHAVHYIRLPVWSVWRSIWNEGLQKNRRNLMFCPVKSPGVCLRLKLPSFQARTDRLLLFSAWHRRV